MPAQCPCLPRQPGPDPARVQLAEKDRIVTIRPPLDGGTVLITGASSGIGRQFAAQLAARAGTLVMVARRAGLLEGLRADLAAAHPRLQVAAVPVDLSDERDADRGMTAVREQVGAVDVLINNAGL